METKKRWTNINIWCEEWFLGLPTKYKLLFNYIKDTCDHAGIWTPEKVLLELILNRIDSKTRAIDLDEALRLFNQGKERFIVLPDGRWYMPDFFVFQYGETLNMRNNCHRSCYEIYQANGVTTEMINGLGEIKGTDGTLIFTTEKQETSKRPQGDPKETSGERNE